MLFRRPVFIGLIFAAKVASGQNATSVVAPKFVCSGSNLAAYGSLSGGTNDLVNDNWSIVVVSGSVSAGTLTKKYYSPNTTHYANWATITGTPGSIFRVQYQRGTGTVQSADITLSSLCSNNGCSGQTASTPFAKLDFGTAPSATGVVVDMATASAGQATTTYNYAGTGTVRDGSYVVRNNADAASQGAAWLLAKGVSGSSTDRFMLVNADYQQDAFYEQTVSGLCASTAYVFSAWLANLMNPSYTNYLNPNVTFQILNAANNELLWAYSTGDIPKASQTLDGTPGYVVWKSYQLGFSLPVGVSSVKLRITNNNPGGNGNDLLLDDITFTSCGPLLSINKTTQTICPGGNVSLAVSGGTSTSAYQWQQSTDNGNSWSDIGGADSASYTSGPLTSTTLFRAKVASNASALGSPNCTFLSPVSTVNVNSINTSIVAGTSTPVCLNSGSAPTITLNATGGVAPYSFVYNVNGGANIIVSSNGSTVLTQPTNAVGTYTYTFVSVTDANYLGCSNNGNSAAITIQDCCGANAGTLSK